MFATTLVWIQLKTTTTVAPVERHVLVEKRVNPALVSVLLERRIAAGLVLIRRLIAVIVAPAAMSVPPERCV